MSYCVAYEAAAGTRTGRLRAHRHRALVRDADRALTRNAIIAGSALATACLIAATGAMLGRDRSFGSLPAYVPSHQAMTIAWVDPEHQAQMEHDPTLASTVAANPPAQVAALEPAAPKISAPATAPAKRVHIPLPHARPAMADAPAQVTQDVAQVPVVPLPQRRPAGIATATGNTSDITGSLGAPAHDIAQAAPDLPPLNEAKTIATAKMTPEPMPTHLAYAAPDEPAKPGVRAHEPLANLSRLEANKPLPKAAPVRAAARSEPKSEPKSIFSLFKRKSPFEKLYGPVQVASLGPTDGLRDDASGIPQPPFDRKTAVYVISDAKVYMPNGSVLEAHSGLGDKMDDPRYVKVRMRGPTPPHVYDLKMRESLFHGVEAIRMLPVGGEDAIYGRDGILAHTYMLGPSGQSNGCVSFRNYEAFLDAFKAGRINRLAVIARLD
ncbi:MAG: hypothetical protein OJF62_003368 [Pseudolabrys sp.]|jgi:hypothetical protein|nr:hypothetical protein [Pseudolabrys sp.]